jgi:nucleotide-binding universal stress UspA family protein
VPQVLRVLVGYDGSAQALEAVRLAGALARQAGARVTVLSVEQPPASALVLGLPGAAGATAARAVAAETELRTAARITAEEAAALLRPLGVSAEARGAVGSATEVLAGVAEREGLDLLVVGHQGKGALIEALLGSTAKRLAGDAPCPVLVARGPAPKAIRRVLVALNDSGPAHRAVEAAAPLARACGAALTLLHVTDTKLLARSHRAESMLRLRLDRDTSGKVALLWASELCRRVGVEPEVVQATGAAGATILAQAQSQGADLVAIGRRERRGLDRFALGSVSDAVLGGARCPVLLAGAQVETVETVVAPAPSTGASTASSAQSTRVRGEPVSTS